mgnify:FL=1
MCRVCEEFTTKNLEEIDKNIIIVKRKKADLKKLTKGLKIKPKIKERRYIASKILL